MYMDLDNQTQENEASECRWENSKKVCVNYVTIQYPDWKFLTLIRQQTFFSRCVLWDPSDITQPRKFHQMWVSEYKRKYSTFIIENLLQIIILFLGKSVQPTSGPCSPVRKNTKQTIHGILDIRSKMRHAFVVELSWTFSL